MKISIPDQNKTLKKNPIMLKYCSEKYMTQKMCDKALEGCLWTWKFVADWFVSSKIIEILNNVVFSNNDIGFDYIDSDIVTFFSDDMEIYTIDLSNINLDGNGNNDDDLETMIHVRLMSLVNEYKECKGCNEELSKELMHVAWWDWCMTEDKKKEIKQFLIYEN